MTETPYFEPIRPAHAIERCAAVIAFDQPLPTKPYEKVAILLDEQMRALRYSQVGLAFDIKIEEGRVSVEQKQNMRAYTSADQASQFTLMPTMLVWQTSRYVRWAPFRGDFERLARPILNHFLDIVSIASVKLEYVDRFIWTGELSSIDPSRLLRVESGLIAPSAMRVGAAWHSHCGWFEFVGNERRLVNVNVDVVEILTPPQAAKPSIGIYTMMQINPGQADLKPQFPVLENLDQLHLSLKELLGKLIVKDMADRIELNPGKKHDSGV